MARTINMEDVKRGDTVRPYPEDVLWSWEDNGRFGEPDPAEIDKKANSLEEHGQLTPVLYSLTHDKKLKLEAGFYRLMAMVKINKSRPADKRMRLEGVVKDGNPEEMFLKNIAENRDRKDTGVIDDAHNVRRLAEQFGKSDEEICAIYGREIDAETGKMKPMSPAWLENMRKLLRLSKELQLKIAKGEIPATTGYLLADMDPGKHEEVLAAAGADGKITTTKALKAARKAGAKVNAGLRAAEEKAAWAYVEEHDKNARMKKLAATVRLWRAGELPEPDFFAELRKLLS